MLFENNKQMVLLSIILAFGIPAIVFVAFFNLGQSVGTSMLPTIPDGDLTIGLKVFDRQNIAAETIIAYQNGTISILHRVIDYGVDGKGKFYICKGDNNPVADPWLVRPEQIREVIIWVEPLWAILLRWTLLEAMLTILVMTPFKVYERHNRLRQTGGENKL